MAGNIKGISLEIGGDTTPLQKALKKVNSEAKNTQNELKQIDRLLKLDPKNTELLAQKQQLLGKQLDDSKNKLEALRAAKDKADADMQKGTEVNAEEYRRLQREIVQAEQEVKTLTIETSKFTAAGEKLQSVGGKMTEIGQKGMAVTKVLTGAGVAMAGLAAKSAKAADDISTMSKKTGLSVEEIQKLKYASEIIDVPLETVTGSLAKLTKNMASAQKGSKNVKAAFDELGVSYVDNEGKLRSNQDVFNDTIAALSKVENETERDALAMQIFGKSAQDLNPLILGGADALKELGAEAEAAGIILDEDAINKATEFQDAMDKLKATTDGQFNKIGAEIAEALLPILESLSSKLQVVFDWFGNLSTGQQQAIIVIGAIIAVIPPLLMLCGSLITSIGTITAFIGKLTAAKAADTAATVAETAATTAETAATTGATAAQTALNLAFLACPVTWIIAAIVALVATFVILWNKCEGFRNFWITCWEYIKTGTAAVIDALKTFFTETIPNAFNKTIDFVKTNWKELLLLITNPIAGAIALLYKLNPKFKEWVDNLVAGIKEKFAKMKEIGKYILEGLWNGINDKVEWLKGKVKGVVDKIKSWFTGKDGFDEHSPSKWAETVGKFLMEGLSNGITEDMSAEAALEKKLSNIKDFITQNIDSIQNDIKQKQDKFADSLSGGSLYNTNTVQMGEESFTYFTLHDFTKDTQRNIDFGNSLSELENRLYGVSENTDMNISFMQMVRDMGMDNAMLFIRAALSASDSDFANYIFGWQEYTKSAEAVAAQTYKNEAEQLKDGFLDTVTENLSETVDNFFTGGENSAQAFGQGFMQKIQTVMSEISARIESYNSVFNLGTASSLGSSSTTNNSTTNYNMSITNNAGTPSAYEQRTQFKRMLNSLALEARA